MHSRAHSAGFGAGPGSPGADRARPSRTGTAAPPAAAGGVRRRGPRAPARHRRPGPRTRRRPRCAGRRSGRGPRRSRTPRSRPARRRRTPRSATRPAGPRRRSGLARVRPGACRRQYEACPRPPPLVRRDLDDRSPAPGGRARAADARGLRATPGGSGFPDLRLAAEQHAALVTALEEAGAEVDVLLPAEGLADACYTYDPVFVTGAGMVVLRQAKPCRSAEPPLLASELAGLGVPEVGRLTGDARADGGDLFWLDEHTLAAGRSHRTNAEAHAQLAALLEPEGVTRAALPPPVAPRPGRGPAPHVGHQPGGARPGGRLRADRADAAPRRARRPRHRVDPGLGRGVRRPRLQHPRHRSRPRDHASRAPPTSNARCATPASRSPCSTAPSSPPAPAAPPA